MYRKARRDSNEQNLVKYLRRIGCPTILLDDGGVPDILTSWQGITLLLEVKSDTGTLTESQTEFFEMWQGHKAIIRTIKDIKDELRLIQMPIRTYVCTKCGEFDKKENFKDDPLTICPMCGNMIAQRYTLCGIIFKGDGWYGKKETAKN